MKAQRDSWGETDRQQSEPTDPDYADKRLARLKAEYAACPREWKQCFLGGLSKYERDYCLGKNKSSP